MKGREALIRHTFLVMEYVFEWRKEYLDVPIGLPNRDRMSFGKDKERIIMLNTIS